MIIQTSVVCYSSEVSKLQQYVVKAFFCEQVLLKCWWLSYGASFENFLESNTMLSYEAAHENFIWFPLQLQISSWIL